MQCLAFFADTELWFVHFNFALSNICFTVPQKWGYQDTPAKELMKQRGVSHTPDEPRLPAYLAHGRLTPSSAFMPLGRLQGQFYHVPTNVGLLRAWGHPGKPHYGQQRFWNPLAETPTQPYTGTRLEDFFQERWPKVVSWDSSSSRNSYNLEAVCFVMGYAGRLSYPMLVYPVTSLF